jgi:hypothetical protein
MKKLLTIFLLSVLAISVKAQLVPGGISHHTLAGINVAIFTPDDYNTTGSTYYYPLMVYHGGNGVSNYATLIAEGDSTLPKILANGWWNGKQFIPGGYVPQGGGSRDTAKFFVVMLEQQLTYPPTLHDLFAAILTTYKIDTNYVSFHGWSEGGRAPLQFKTRWNLSNDTYSRKVKKMILAAPGYPNVDSWDYFAGAKARIYFDSTDNITGEGPAYSSHNAINAVAGASSQIYDLTGQGYGHDVTSPAFQKFTGTSAITNNYIWLISETAGNPPPRCSTGTKIPLTYDNIIDLEGASNFAYDSVFHHFNGQPGKAVDGERVVFDVYNDSAYYGPGGRKGRKVLVVFSRMMKVDSVKGTDSSSSSNYVKVYPFRGVTYQNHSTYDSILNAHNHTPKYTWTTSAGAFTGVRKLQENMDDTVMMYLFNFYGPMRMSFDFFGCELEGGPVENLLLPVPDTITYIYPRVDSMKGDNFTQFHNNEFIRDTAVKSGLARFYDNWRYYDADSLNNTANRLINLAGAGNQDSIAASYGLRSIQSTRGGNGYSVKEVKNRGQAETWEIRQTNSITDNPSVIDNYTWYAKFQYTMTAKKGRNTNIQYTRDSLNYVGDDTVTFGKNINIGRELSNEDDKDWLPIQTAKPQHIFAKCAAAYDGDRGRLGTKIGVKNADSTMLVVYPGTVSFRTEWHRASFIWSFLYYGERYVPWDVSDYHLGTSNKIFTKSPYSSEVVGVKGTYPEYFDDAARLTYVIKLLSRLLARQVKVFYGEYAVSQAYDWPRMDNQVGSVSVLATPIYEGVNDQLLASWNIAERSAAINFARTFLVNTETPAWGAAGYEFHDNSGYKNTAAYKINDQSNGKYTRAPYPVPDTIALWPRYYVQTSIADALSGYRFDGYIQKVAGGRYVTRYRKIANPDTVIVITRKSDTAGAALAYNLPVGGATSVLRMTPSYSSLSMTLEALTPEGQLVSAPNGAMPVLYKYLEVEGENLAPTAAAGVDLEITLPTNSVVVSGAGSSDPDGTIAGYAWSKTGGPATYTIVSPNTAVTTISGLVAGTYEFTLTVTDDDGAIDTDTIIVTVQSQPTSDPIKFKRYGRKRVIHLP